MAADCPVFAQTFCCLFFGKKINSPFSKLFISKVFIRGLPLQWLLNRCDSIDLVAIACICHSSPLLRTWRLQLLCCEKCRLDGPAALFMSLFSTVEPSLTLGEANPRAKTRQDKAFSGGAHNSDLPILISYRR
jgi:hypothetical protein